MNIHARITLMAIFCFLAVACAEKPDGTIVMNEQTIENFFEGEKGPLKAWDPASDLNLLINQPVARADLPVTPANQKRVSGTLTSAGTYKIRDPELGIVQRGSRFKNSIFGMLGNAGENGNAWFFADFDPETGTVINARAYLYNFNGGVCDLRKSANGSYGKILDNSFTFTIDGMCAFPDQPGSTAEFALLIEGKGNLQAKPVTDKFDIRYIVSDTGKFTDIPQNPSQYPAIFGYGTGTAQITD